MRLRKAGSPGPSRIFRAPSPPVAAHKPVNQRQDKVAVAPGCRTRNPESPSGAQPLSLDPTEAPLPLKGSTARKWHDGRLKTTNPWAYFCTPCLSLSRLQSDAFEEKNRKGLLLACFQYNFCFEGDARKEDLHGSARASAMPRPRP